MRREKVPLWALGPSPAPPRASAVVAGPGLGGSRGCARDRRKGSQGSPTFLKHLQFRELTAVNLGSRGSRDGPRFTSPLHAIIRRVQRRSRAAADRRGFRGGRWMATTSPSYRVGRVV